jgi:hypothetical protein
VVQNFLLETLKGRDHSEDLGVDGNIILQMDLREISWCDMDRMHLAQDRNQWRAVVNKGMNIRVP